MKRSTSDGVRRGRRDPGRESRWRGLLEQQRRSGLTVRAFCFREGLRESAFHYWRREIARRDGQAFRPDGEASRPASGETGNGTGKGTGTLRPGVVGPGFVELRSSVRAEEAVAGASPGGVSIELLLSGGRRLLIRGGGNGGSDGALDGILLRRVLDILENRPC